MGVFDAGPHVCFGQITPLFQPDVRSGAPDRANTSGAPVKADSTPPDAALALLLDLDPEFAEVVSVWKLLPEHVRQTIVTLARTGTDKGD